MRRADRDIEMLDLKTLDVLIGGLGGNPKNMGLKAPLDAFAPRVGAVYRLNEDTVLRSGYGLTYDSQAHGRPGGVCRVTSSTRSPSTRASSPRRRRPSSAGTARCNDGIPRLDGPDISTGRVPLPNAIGMQSVAPETMHRGKTHSWNVAFERRLPIVSVDVAYVGNKRVGGLAQINVNPVQHLGGGAADRPYFVTNGRQLAVNVYRAVSATSDYNALQVGVTRPLTNGLLLKGHYTYSRSMALAYNYQLPTEEAADRNWALAAGDRPHTMTMSFVYMLPWQTSTGGRSIVKSIINDWQVNGIFQAFSGSPFTVTADATELNTPNNTQTADLVGTVTKVGGIGAEGVYFDPAAWAAADGCALRHVAAEPVPWSRRLEPGLLRVPDIPHRQPPEDRAARRSVQPDEHAEVRQPDEQLHQRRLHAHLRSVQRVCGAAGAAGGAVQLLNPEIGCVGYVAQAFRPARAPKSYA